MNIHELETPCLLLEKRKVQNNIAHMENKMRALGVKLRPHGKTAKNIDVINLLSPANRQSITVSTLKEAEYYFENGIEDITYAVGISPNKLNRAADLIKKGAKLTLLLDSVEQARFCALHGQAKSVEFAFLIEIDADGDRGGIRCDDDNLLLIAQCAAQNQGIRLEGVLTHAGGSYKSSTTAQIEAMAEQERLAAVSSAEKLKQAGFECNVVSVGSTPTALFAQDLTGVTEVRAGVFMFYDLVMYGLGVCDMEDIGISVLTSIIGKNPQNNSILTDAGWMAMSRDRGTQGQQQDFGYGQVCDVSGSPLENLIVSGTNQEHGVIDYIGAEPEVLEQLDLGKMLRILPNHACATAAMYASYFVIEDGHRICEQWTRVNGW